MEKIKIVNRVREARRAAGLTQVELADRLDVTRQTIGLIEADRYNPTIRLCLMIARETGVSLDWLFQIKEED